jgi:hypothetical protein
MSYGFPIINFCNPGVQYEMPCIMSCDLCNSVKEVLMFGRIIVPSAVQ